MPKHNDIAHANSIWVLSEDGAERGKQQSEGGPRRLYLGDGRSSTMSGDETLTEYVQIYVEHFHKTLLNVGKESADATLPLIEAAADCAVRPKPTAALSLRSKFNRTRSGDACERGGNSLEVRVL